ncbi:MAG: S-layer homology domain-containing protein [Pseudoflavonifractor sp.]|nr:S-layer homology domain-containing protein [Pseudoflavonifractor sp.]
MVVLCPEEGKFQTSFKIRHYNGAIKYSGYVGWAADSGIVEGDGQGSFMPDTIVTAEQMTLMLQRYAGENYTASTNFSGKLTRGQLAQMLLDVL